ncbi:MAG: glycosyltransferase family 4 protein [Bacteroidetes bacterium]|nr:glycosyltransferase family 4 protein [Bacteroidota bacterium]
MMVMGTQAVQEQDKKLTIISLFDWETGNITGMKRFVHEILEPFDSAICYRKIIVSERGGRRFNQFLRIVINQFLYIPFQLLFVHRIRKATGPILITSQHLIHQIRFLRKRTKFVIIFDLIDLSIYTRYPKPMQQWLLQFLYKAVKKADQVITISDYSKSEIINKLKIDPAKVKVIYICNELNRFRPIAKKDRDKLRSKLGFSSNKFIILNVGSDQPRKNIETLIKALALLKESIHDFIFIKIGEPQWPGSRDRLLALVRNLELSHDVKFINYTDENQLADFYNICDVFVMPSLYEGFGVPLIEAMASGIPVVTTKLTAIPEIVENAAYYINEPKCSSELASAIYHVISDPSLSMDLAARSLKQSQKFDPKNERQKFWVNINKLIYQ